MESRRARVRAYSRSRAGTSVAVTSLSYLLPNNENRKRIRDDLAAARASTRLRRGSRRTKLSGDQDDVVRLSVERARSGAHHGRQGLFHHETGRAVLLDDGQRAIALRAERFHRIRVEKSAVRQTADRQRGEDFAVIGVEDHHIRWVAAGGKQDAVLGIHGEA